MLCSKNVMVKLAFTHEIFEVVPLDIVGEVADVDATVLLGGLADVAHHLLLSYLAVFEGTLRLLWPAAVVGGAVAASSVVVAVHWRALATAAPVVLAVPAWGTGAVAVAVTPVWRARAGLSLLRVSRSKR